MFRDSLGREFFIELVEEMLTADVIGEYAQQHMALADVEVEVSVDVSPPEECEPLDRVLSRLNAGEEISEEAHQALLLADVHPNPAEYFTADDADGASD
jgi:hypothetical protein